MTYFFEDQDHLHPQVDLFNDSPVAPSPLLAVYFLFQFWVSMALPSSLSLGWKPKLKEAAS
jgi:hypothetical protein